MIPKRIDEAWLKRRKACPWQVADFAAEWPDGAALTRANLLRAAELALDIDWLARTILTATALMAYRRAMVPAWAAYERVTAEARAKYRRVKASALADALGLPEEADIAMVEAGAR